MKTNKELSYHRALERVDRLRNFYYHASVYLVVNLVISVYKVIRNLNQGETFSEAFLDLNTFIVWLLWGIGLALHAFSVFGLPLLLGRNWEERKIEKYMMKDRGNSRN